MQLWECWRCAHTACMYLHVMIVQAMEMLWRIQHKTESMQAHSITLCYYDFCDYCLGLLHACTW